MLFIYISYEFRFREYRNLDMYHLSIPGIVHAIDVASAPVCPVASAIETGASYHQYRFLRKSYIQRVTESWN